jgi:hypothetical protein
VNRCRFRNVCPEWKQRKLARQPESPGSASASAAALLVAANEGGLSSRGLGVNGLQNNSNNSNGATGDGYNNGNNNNSDSSGGDRLSSLSAASSTVSGSQQGGGQDGTEDEGCKDYEDIFQNGEEDEFMILDVVMNVVSDEVVLGFFHIDGRKCFFFTVMNEGEPTVPLFFQTCGLVEKERKKRLSITSAGVGKERKKAQNSNNDHGS